MNKRQRKNLDDFFRGTFDSGGIFDEAAKVEFKKKPTQERKGPSLEDLLRRQVQEPKPQQSPADKKKADKIRKLEALANDPGAAPAERESAKRMADKLRG